MKACFIGLLTSGGFASSDLCTIGEGSINCEHAQLRRDIDNGEWVAVKHFLNRNPDAKSARISDNGGTVLHVAVSAKRTDFVEKLVAELMSKEELEITDDNGLTALARAAILKNKGMVECMRRKNAESLNIPDYWGCIPLVTALEYGNIKMADYLYSVCQTLSNVDASTALTRFILLDNFGLALKLLKRFPDSAIVKNKYHTFPHSLRSLLHSRVGSHTCFGKIGSTTVSISIQYSANTGEFQIRNNGLVLGLLCWLPWNLLVELMVY
ncbi:uncharacterized protein LOC132171583 [Corylus avellana]|uniref:uncharacterized protein LOC132171583 n=1 Tax=Corylus avellana TaxID=13451 RepID=UPI00286CA3A9|nr:uncharacterized protein LOC132171583 [Corylus avellana]